MPTQEEITARLDEYLETEFTFIRTEPLARRLAELPEEELSFILEWVRRAAATHTQLACQLAQRAPEALTQLDPDGIAAWVRHAMDVYDSAGLRPALAVIREADQFLSRRHERTAGAAFEAVERVLAPFVRGLAGRPLRLAVGEAAYTDSETLFLPALLARLPHREDNFRLYQLLAVLMWAQIRYGTFRLPLSEALARFPDPARALRLFHALETRRLSARVGQELPGLARAMVRLRAAAGEAGEPVGWAWALEHLHAPAATAADSLALVAELYDGEVPPPLCYQGELRPEAVAACLAARVAREKVLLRVRLAEWLREQPARQRERDEAPPRLAMQPAADPPAPQEGHLELTLDDVPVAPPEDVARLLTSIQLDLGAIPDEYLVPAGPGEYDPSLYQDQAPDQEEVLRGTYHEHGALYYDEWDHRRQHYRKQWCVVREWEVPPLHDGFAAATLEKYDGLVRRLRRSFEALRDEDRIEKRQAQGDGVDIDALVEALADAHDGREMSDRLFTRLHRQERNIAVVFLVDMSGSTRGHVNQSEREALILLCEALERLGDRYAIYGFSGISRKRCDLYRIKRFGEGYDDTVRARIGGIQPQDYTRMGFAIRHMSRLLQETDARSRLLITLSDGKPDDYTDYRGEYGIEDTRRALLEARRCGIHPFCITIDSAGPAYLPHMYGPASWVVVDEVRLLPLKVADIYRRLTRR